MHLSEFTGGLGGSAPQVRGWVRVCVLLTINRSMNPIMHLSFDKLYLSGYICRI